MTSLSKPLRNELARTVLAARKLAEAAAGKALHALGVDEADAPGHLDNEGRRLRVRLRAQARQLGDREDRQKKGCYEIGHLTEKIAYDHWHRLLFARFLAENDLLISPDHGVGISLDYCGDLAPELGLRDGWEVAANFAARMLPEIFRADDPAGSVVFAPEDRVALRKLVTDLPPDIFLAGDALGWVYQFWQAQRKDEVNKSGNKIGADEIAPVTQLFTEDYMVQFLLHNTLGAWWAGKQLAVDSRQLAEAKTEDELRKAVALPGVDWEYLRFVKVARASRSGSSSDPIPDRDGLATTAEPDRDGLATLAEPDRDGLATIGLHAESLRIGEGENVPHWTCDHAIYHVVFRLADSVPKAKREEWIRERESITETAKREGRELTADEEDRLRFLYSERIEKFLDSGHGECLLRQPQIADLVAGAIRHFEGERYTLHAWSVMPNHVHVIVEPLPGHDLSKIVHSWKSFTAHAINKRLEQTGDVWQHDAYNHIIRSEKEYAFQVAYVWNNPDKAGLHDWRWRGMVARPSRSGEVTRASRSGEVARASRSGSSSDPIPDRDGLATPSEPDRDGLATLAEPDRDGLATPAAGTFDGWPKTARELRLLDPSMGSGHFLVFELPILVAMRMAEEGLTTEDAVEAVLRDNLFGLEIDPRCTQIAAFNLALAAWKLIGQYRQLPPLNLACCGLGINARKEDWLKLAEPKVAGASSSGNSTNTPEQDAPATLRLRGGMEQLYELFQKAPVLGSLIDPRKALGDGDLFTAEFHDLAPYLEQALARETRDDAAHEMAVVAQGLAKAAEILAGQFTLVATNVPYLGRGKQDDTLKDYCLKHHPDAKADLATCFVERCLAFCNVARPSRSGKVARASRSGSSSDTIAIPDYDGPDRDGLATLAAPDRDGLATMGTTALVTPQNWLFLGTYKKLRETLLKTETWEFVTRLGPKGFQTPMWDFNITLLALSNQVPPQDHALAGLDVAEQRTPAEKVAALRNDPMASASQMGQLENPDCAIALVEADTTSLLQQYAKGLAGVLNGDCSRFEALFWEMEELGTTWEYEQTTVTLTIPYGGREKVIRWEAGNGQLRQFAAEAKARLHDADRRGNEAWGNYGVVISSIGRLAATLYTGEKFDTNTAVIYPREQRLVPAIWCFCSSPDFAPAVRRITQKLNVTNATMVKVPFDLVHWQKVAEEKYPNGLPKPHSDDPTQWLFDGFPKVARPSRSGSSDTMPDRDGLATTAAPDRDGLATLQVAVARLLGYRWPRQTGSSFPDCSALGPDGLEPFADADGIVCLNAIKGEQSGAERLRALLAAAVARPSRSGSSSDTIAIPDQDGPDRDGLATPAEPDRDGLATIPDLLRAVGYAGKTLDDWLRNGFFEQHCQLFHQRPFIWQVWDGLRDGFSALVNYHRLDRRVLEKLIYTYLGDWIARQKAAVAADEEGSDAKLAAAQKLKDNLEKILEGEAPYDIFVRWKPLKKQPIGWEPDLNDGVRLNIRPFVEAGILRRTPKIHWRKDRGKDVTSAPWYKLFQGDRINDHHLTLKEKREARERIPHATPRAGGMG